MKLKNIMTEQVHVVEPDLDLEACAVKMKDHDVGALPICDGEKILGLITDRDIVTKAVTEGGDPKEMRARDIMSSPIVFAFEDDDIGSAARLMEVRQIRRLIVLNHEKKLVGIVTLSDVALKGDDMTLSAEVLQKVCNRTQPKAA